MNQSFCPACLQSLNGLSVCAKCGWYASIKVDPLYLRPGTVVNPPYQVARVLGHGGFGITYLGWDANLQIKVAIKEYLPRDFAYRNPQTSQVLAHAENTLAQFQTGLTRFLDEARTLAKFQQHPGIVSVLSFFPAFGTGYMVMEYVEGQTLNTYLNQHGCLNWTQTLDIFMHIMDALRTVHKAGLLHSDIAPDNIYLCSDGRIKLLDFGAAQSSLAGQITASKTLMVKPGFAPQEQYLEAGQQGAWSDVYSVAASIYFCLTGQIPPDALLRLKRDTLKPPSALGVVLPSQAEQVLLSALAVDSLQRPQSIESLQIQLMQQSTRPIAEFGVRSLPDSELDLSVLPKQKPKQVFHDWHWGLLGIACVVGLMLLFRQDVEEQEIPPVQRVVAEPARQVENSVGFDEKALRQLREQERLAAEELKLQQAAALKRFEERRQQESPATIQASKTPENRSSEHMRSLCDEWGATMGCQKPMKPIDRNEH